MNEDIIQALAAYFTGPCVARNSIALAKAGMSRDAALRFFSVRDKLGVTGYDSAEVAEKKIKASLRCG